MQNEQFVRNFNFLMDEHGVTNYRMAKIMKVHATTIANWRNGVSVPNREKLERISIVFGIMEDQLLGENYPPIEKGKHTLISMYKRADSTEYLLKVSKGEMPNIGSFCASDVMGKIGYTFTNDEFRLIEHFAMLNHDGQEKAIERVAELTEVPKYLNKK